MRATSAHNISLKPRFIDAIRCCCADELHAKRTINQRANNRVDMINALN